jgi:predicted DNA-binding transcriptional regulator YafY
MAKHHRVARLLEIVELVKSNSEMRPRDLARQFGISEKRIYDDIGDLNMAGVPIVFHQGGYKILPSYFNSGDLFTPDDAFRLTLGLNLLVQQGIIDESVRQQILRKIFGSVSDIDASNLSQLTSRTTTSTLPSNKIPKNILESVCSAISGNRALQVEYNSLSGGGKSVRDIHPYFLTFKKNTWYLLAYCCERANVRTFKMSRISKIRVLDRTFRPPPLEDYIRDLDERWGIMDGVEEKIVVRFDTVIAPYIREKVIPRSTVRNHRNGSMTLTIKTRGVDEFCWWLQQYGCHAEVLSPPKLRERMLSDAQATLSIYQRKPSK